MFFFTDGKQHQAHKHILITLKNHARSYMTLLPVTLSVHDMIIDDITGADFENLLYDFGQWEKR